MAEQSLNPFSQLFGSEIIAVRAAEEGQALREYVSHTLTRILLLTGADSLPPSCGVSCVVRLPQLSSDPTGGHLTPDNLEKALAERLYIDNAKPHLLSCTDSSPKAVKTHGRAQALMSGVSYLASCFTRSADEANTGHHDSYGLSADVENVRTGVIEKCQQTIGKMAGILIQMEHRKAMIGRDSADGSIFTSQVLATAAQVLGSPLAQFYAAIAQAHQDTASLAVMFEGSLQKLFDESKSELGQTSAVAIELLKIFLSSKHLAKALTGCRHWLPPLTGSAVGKAFEEQTILGRLLAPSPVSPLTSMPSKYFPVDEQLSRRDVDETTSSLHSLLDYHTQSLFSIFDQLLRVSPDAKAALISWLVKCFQYNQSRAKMGSHLTQRAAYQMALETAGNGFFLNLCWVLIRLCRPFVAEGGVKREARIASINPGYCDYNKSQKSELEIVDFSGDSKLVPTSDEAPPTSRAVSDPGSFNFITHLFFLTHKCLIITMTPITTELKNLGRTIHSLQEMAQIDPEGGRLTQQLRILQSRALSIQAHALCPAFLENCFLFYATTAQWLVQLVAKSCDGHKTSGDPLEAIFPLPSTCPVELQSTPECLVENMANFTMFLSQVDTNTMVSSQSQVHHLITFTTIFMGSSNFIRNPHIRAKLAQLLNIVTRAESSQQFGLIPSFSEGQRMLFAQHSLASNHLIEALLSIFIDIEFTGESMEFEDKFQYRLPMYDVLEFLWSLPSYRPSIDRLCAEVVVSHDLLDTPLFLRFINMIMNDATVQLDEGLENLAKIKKIEDLMNDSTSWEELSHEDQEQQKQQLSEAKMMASNRILLGSRTVRALHLITDDTRQAFVSPALVDRMAAMLNDVLSKLVGPQSRELKVSNADQYHFKPRELVCDIISVYLNLGKEEVFCEALPRDGRSFSLKLLPSAEQVLNALGKSEMVGELRVLMERVRQCAVRQQLQEEALEDAPNEFLDPLTQELMSEPVTLPTSGHVVDRSSIIRHLLSDQSDPFSRAPLTADMLEPNKELKQKIEEWKKDKLSKSKTQ